MRKSCRVLVHLRPSCKSMHRILKVRTLQRHLSKPLSQSMRKPALKMEIAVPSCLTSEPNSGFDLSTMNVGSLKHWTDLR
jgi:hypothetical protein